MSTGETPSNKPEQSEQESRHTFFVVGLDTETGQCKYDSVEANSAGEAATIARKAWDNNIIVLGIHRRGDDGRIYA